MDLSALLLGVTVWLVVSANYCDAAPFSGQDHLDGPFSPQGSTATGSEKIVPQNKAAESPLKPSDVTDITKEHSTTDPTSDKMLSIPSALNDDRIEEEEENGIIRGKYSYVEDGIPVQLEYEAIPQVKFEVTKYIKGSKILPLPDINGPESSPALYEKNLEPILYEKDPTYEHASVIGKHLKTNIRKTRSTTNKQDHQSHLDESEISEISESAENDETDVGKSDASYKFGFSADGQTRDEESDAEGSVQGSYSYVGQDGVVTKVEYEAGAGRGFNVKKIVQLPGPINLDQSSNKLNADVEVSSSQNVESEDHQIQTLNKAATENQELNGDPNNQNNDGSYSFSYATPDQWREESVDSSGHINSRFYSVIRDNTITETQLNDLTKEFIDKEFTPRMTNFLSNLFLTNMKSKNSKPTSDDGPYLSPYEATKTSDEPNGEKTVKSSVSSDGVIELKTRTENLKEITNPIPLEGEAYHPTSGGESNQQYIDTSLATALDDDSSPNQRAEPHPKHRDNLALTKHVVPQQGVTAPEEEKIMTKQTDEPTISTLTNPQPDGSYSFAYGNKDQMRKESVDTKGNVFSSYQYKTKDGGRTVVVIKRKIVKDILPAINDSQKQFKRNIPSDNMNRAQRSHIEPFRGKLRY